MVGDDKYLLLGRTIVPDPTLFGTAFVPITHDSFRYWKAQIARASARDWNDRVTEIQRIQQGARLQHHPDDDDPYPPDRPSLLHQSRQPGAGRARYNLAKIRPSHFNAAPTAASNERQIVAARPASLPSTAISTVATAQNTRVHPQPPVASWAKPASGGPAAANE